MLRVTSASPETATSPAVTALQVASVDATACVTVAVSSSASSSWAAVTVTVWAVLQLTVVKVRVAGEAVTSVLSVGSVMVTVRLWLGWVSSFTV